MSGVAFNPLAAQSSLPFALLGIVCGIIFVTDGWLSYQGAEQSFSKSPKVRGLLYILGGGFIPAFRELTRDTSVEHQTNTISVYTLFVSLSILLGLFILGAYAFLVSFKRLRKTSINESWLELVIESLPFVYVAIQEGNRRFTEVIENRLILKANEQRDEAIEFLATAYNDLIKSINESREGCEYLENFIKSYLERFIRQFLDDSRDNYRACVFYLDRNSNDLVFFTGFSPQTAPHTEQRLPVRRSLAGYALENPYKVHLWVAQRTSDIPFCDRKPLGRYKSVAACAIKNPIHSRNSDLPQMVLSIDCIYDTPNAFGDFEYTAKMIVLLSGIFAGAQVLMKVNDKDVGDYIQ
jgi:uncharacterized membrane protein YphA (DoxX/SURF4 family)